MNKVVTQSVLLFALFSLVTSAGVYTRRTTIDQVDRMNSCPIPWIPLEPPVYDSPLEVLQDWSDWPTSGLDETLTLPSEWPTVPAMSTRESSCPPDCGEEFHCPPFCGEDDGLLGSMFSSVDTSVPMHKRRGLKVFRGIIPDKIRTILCSTFSTVNDLLKSVSTELCKPEYSSKGVDVACNAFSVISKSSDVLVSAFGCTSNLSSSRQEKSYRSEFKIVNYLMRKTCDAFDHSLSGGLHFLESQNYFGIKAVEALSAKLRNSLEKIHNICLKL